MCDFVADTFVVLRASGLRGLALEQVVARLARSDGHRTVVQKPRSANVFGRLSASGLRHEIDTAIVGLGWVGFVEVKGSATGANKNDLLVFDGKTQDIYVDRVLAHRPGPHFRIVVSTSHVRQAIASFAMQRSILTVEPDLIPLPMLLRLVRDPAICERLEHFDAVGDMTLLNDASRSMEDVWELHRGGLYMPLARFALAWAAHARSVHEAWSKRVLECLDAFDPDWSARRWAALGSVLRVAI